LKSPLPLFTIVLTRSEVKKRERLLEEILSFRA
jgi:hypothetical protein